VKGEKLQDSDYPVIQEAALRWGQETVDEQIEKRDYRCDFLA
jgi:hypothetical protein